ncbi:MAG: lipase family protein [Chitinophagales bacterium]
MRHHFICLLIASFLFACKDKPGNNEKVQSKPAFTDTTACIFSEIAYCSDPQQQLYKFLPGWKVIWNPAAVGGNHAFVATNGSVNVIAFRGSLINFSEDALNNWIFHDLNVGSQEPWPYSNTSKANISTGSYIAWQNVEKMKDKSTGKTLWVYLSENVPENAALFLTGHSLGGNLATVYASYLSWKFNEVKRPRTNINVITFAAPAPGNKSFAMDFNSVFPLAIRFENTNDIVPKFPCSSSIRKLGSLYSPLPSADTIQIGYKNITTSLGNVFSLMGTALDLLELKSDFYGYEHTCSDGKLITIPLSGKNITNHPVSWFAEAGYQHGMAQYAAALGAPVIDCDIH